MLMDKRATFADNIAVPATATTAIFGDYYDLTAGMGFNYQNGAVVATSGNLTDQPGNDEDLYLVGLVTTVFAVGTSLQFKLVSATAVDLTTGQVDTIYTHCGDTPLRGPNALVFDQAGGFWFTDPGKARARECDVGALYHALADGSAITEMSFGLETPNGVGLSPDDATLYVAMTTTGRVYRWKLAGPGRFDSPYPNDRGTLLMADPGENAFDSLAVATSAWPPSATAGSPTSLPTAPGPMCPPATGSPPTSASAAPTCAPPSSPARPPAPW